MSQEDKNKGAFVRLLHWIAANTVGATPDSDRSDRAMRALSGQLSPNPQFVEATFRVLDDPAANVMDVAISPNGKVAMIVVIGMMKDRSLFLVTWSNGTRSVKEYLIPRKEYDVFGLGVFFPEGSEEPAVLIGGSHLRWGDWTIVLPWDKDVPKEACLTAWVEDGLPHVAFIEKDVRATEGGVAWEYTPGKKGGSSYRYRWLGLVDGSLALIRVGMDGDQTLFWRDLEVPQLPSVALARIHPGSISARDGGIQFVAEVSCKNVATWTDGTKRHDIPAPGHLFFDQGEIYGIEWAEIGFRQVVLFKKDRFERFGESTVDMPVLGPNTGFGRFGDTAALWDFHQHEGPAHMRLCYVDAGGTVSAPRMADASACVRLHHGVGLLRKGRNDEPILYWETPVADGHGIYADFPLYNVPFASLVPVEDERGKAVMAALNPEGSATMVILRYPLPKG